MTEPTTTSTGPTNASPLEVAPAASPREMTAEARRAAWAQPAVRFWTLVTAVLLGASVYFALVQTAEWYKEQDLIRNGAKVDATVFQADQKIKNRPIPLDSQADVTYTYEGKEYKVRGDLVEREPTVMSGQVIPIHVDPKDPTVWTDRREVPSLLGKFVAPLLLLPALVVAGVAAILLKKRAANLWRTGEARQAVVIDTKQSPLAPLSSTARCALVEGQDKRLISVTVPHRFGKLAKGQTLWLVTHRGNPQRAIPAVAFQPG